MTRNFLSAFRSLTVERLLPWRVRRLLLLVRLNNVRPLVTFLRFLVRRPKLKIILSSNFFGGVGGTEKLVKSVVDSMPDCEFHIFANELNPAGFVPERYNYYLNLPASHRADYDVYLYFCGGGKPPYLGDQYSFKVKLVDTNAAQIFDIEDKFDHTLVQCEHYAQFCVQHEKVIHTFPDIDITIPKQLKPVAGLPEKFLLTVFNPFSKVQKGQEVLYRLAPSSKWPIVWCYSNVSGWDFSQVPQVENLIQLKNLNQEELYYVYQQASAYVSFAYYESFGWTLAEAYFMDKPIISRKTGIIGYIMGEPGIRVYETEDDLIDIIEKCEFMAPQYEKNKFTDNTYAKVFTRLSNSRGNLRPPLLTPLP